MQDLFEIYRKKNPLGFTEEQLDSIQRTIDTYETRRTVCDEFAEFRLWYSGKKSRQEYFADYVERMLPLDKYKRLLEVGCGRTARLSGLLAAKGYEMTAVDPKVEDIRLQKDDTKAGSVVCRKQSFGYREFDISSYDAVIAQEPCDATEHIIRACLAAKKDFVIALCASAHKKITGEPTESFEEWYAYLEELAGTQGSILHPDIVPFYQDSVMVGRF